MSPLFPSEITSGIRSDTIRRLCSAGGVQFLVDDEHFFFFDSINMRLGCITLCGTDDEHVVLPSRFNVWPAYLLLSSCAGIDFLIPLARSVSNIQVTTWPCVNGRYVGKTSWYGSRCGNGEGGRSELTRRKLTFGSLV